MIKLLIVEDDDALSYIEKTSLEDLIGGYEIETARNGKEGVAKWAQFFPDVIIADIDMPVMNGFEMVERIRETDKEVIIIFTSALTSPNDVKAGYRLGIDNYVKKPFVPEELDAHINALLRLKRGSRPRNETSVYRIGRYSFDATHATLYNNETRKTKTITARESQLLAILVDNRNEVVKRDAILGRLWNAENSYFASRSLDVFVNKLRKILADDDSLSLKTIRGVGLSLVVKNAP